MMGSSFPLLLRWEQLHSNRSFEIYVLALLGSSVLENSCTEKCVTARSILV